MGDFTIKKQIEMATKEYILAFNTKRLDPAVFFTKDCQVIRPGWQTLKGHEEIGSLMEEDHLKLIVCDEIGPDDATDLAYSRGSFVLYTKSEEIVSSGRYVTIWKKIGRKWLIHRDIPLIDHKRDEIYTDIVQAEKEVMDAFNSDDFDPTEYYTEDFMMMPVGDDTMKGLREVNFMHDENKCGKNLKHEIAVESVTWDKNSSLAFSKGYFILHNKGKVDQTGRYLNIWKKVDGKWLLHRNIPNIDQERLAKPLEHDHKGIRMTGNKLLAAYNGGVLEPSKFYTTDTVVIPPSDSAIIGVNDLKEALEEDSRPMIAAPHEVITNSAETLAYEKGHFMYHTKEGEIITAGEYINIWKKIKGSWMIYRDVSHVYYTKDYLEPMIFEEIRMAADRLTLACNSGEVNVTEFYTEDCIVTVPGHEKLIGKRRIQEIYKHIYGSGHHLVHVIEEIGPSTASNLCYTKGHFIDCHLDGDVAHTGRLDCIMKKIDGKWLIYRDMPKVD